MNQEEFLKLLADAAAARNNVDDECKTRLAESQMTVLKRKLNEINKEKDRIFENMADTIMVCKNQLEAYLKIEKHIATEIETLEKELK